MFRGTRQGALVWENILFAYQEMGPEFEIIPEEAVRHPLHIHLHRKHDKRKGYCRSPDEGRAKRKEERLKLAQSTSNREEAFKPWLQSAIAVERCSEEKCKDSPEHDRRNSSTRTCRTI